MITILLFTSNDDKIRILAAIPYMRKDNSNKLISIFFNEKLLSNNNKYILL